VQQFVFCRDKLSITPKNANEEPRSPESFRDEECARYPIHKVDTQTYGQQKPGGKTFVG